MLFSTLSVVRAEDILTISNVQAPTALVRPNTTTITWDTNFPSNSEVHFWSVDKSQENYNWDKIDDYTQTSHTIELKDLKSFTTYYFTVSSKRQSDPAETTSEQGTFTTTIAATGTVSNGPVISNLAAPDALLRPNYAVITWETNVEADSLVYYAEAGNNNYSWQGTDDFSKNHTVKIPSLKSFTTYQYYVNAKDRNGALTKSPTKEFTTTIDSLNNPQTVEISKKAKDLSNDNVEAILAQLKQLRDEVREQKNEIKYLRTLMKGVTPINEKAENAITNFITYGVSTSTKKIGENERAAVAADYKAAFKKLPDDEKELADMIRIADGYAPLEKSIKAEQAAKEQFLKIYKRVPDMNDATDSKAVKIMAYGVRSAQKNAKAESQAVDTFKSLHKHNPTVSADWTKVRAIAYSGATKKKDSDNDGVADDLEKKLGTNPKKADTDGDGFKDGVEVMKGFNPLKKNNK